MDREVTILSDIRYRRWAGRWFIIGIMCAAWMAVFQMESRAEEAGTEQGMDVSQSADASQNSDVSQSADASQSPVTVEYNNLRELLKTGNISLKKSFENNEENIEAYQEMWDIMKREQENMEDKAEEADDSEDAILYSSNALSLKMSASRVYSQLKTMTNEKSTKNLEKTLDSSLLTAQTLMNSYGQMVQNVEARQKSAEALTAAYEETVRKQSIGSATSADVLSAKNQMDLAVNSLGELKEQAAQSRRQLLTMLGLPDSANVTIAAIPEPDLAAIDSIDFESDKTKAINNNSNVISTRHTTARSTTAINQRFKQVDQAEGSAEADITSTYQELMAKRIEYQGALSAYNSAQIAYQSLQNKMKAGMLSNTDYLEGEAEYAQKKAAKETASMNLMQAYEAYCWEVKGVG